MKNIKFEESEDDIETESLGQHEIILELQFGNDNFAETELVTVNESEFLVYNKNQDLLVNPIMQYLKL